MADNDNRYRLWQTISKEYDLPDYNQFSKDMEDATKRKSLHDAVSAEYDLPDFDQFSKDMGYGQQTTQQTTPQGNQNTQNVKKPQQTTQSSQVEEGRGVLGDNGYNKQKIAHEKEASQAWNNLAHKGRIKWTIEGHPEVKMVAVTDDLVKRFPQLEQSRGYQVPFNMSTGTPIMQNIDDKGNIITPDEASEQYTKILTNQDFDYVPKQETAAVQIGSVVNTALSTKGGWLDRAVQKAMEENFGKDWKDRKYESDGKEISASEIYAKAKQGIYDNINGVLGDIRKSLLFSTDEQRRQTVDELYQKGYLKEDFLPKANALHYISNVDKGEQVEELRQRILKLQVQREVIMDKLNQIPQPDHAENMAEFYARRANDGSELYASDLRKIDKQIAQYDAVIDELEGRNNLKSEWGHAVQTSGITGIGAWDFGVTDLKDAMMMYPLAKKMQNGDTITQDDYISLKLLSQANEADAVENAVMPSSYNMFKGSLQSVPFTVQFLAGGEFAKGATAVIDKAATRTVKGAILKAGGKKALKAAEKVAEKAADSKILKFCGMLGKDFRQAFVMENTTGAATTGAEILNRHIGTVTESDDGFKMEGESLPTAIIKGEMSQNIELQTEFLGEHFPSSLKFIRGMAHTKVGSAMGLRNLAAWLTKVSRTEFATTLKSYATRAGINGVFGEYLEEVAGTAENALLVGDQKFSDLLDVKQQEEVAGSVVLSCLGMGIFGTAIYTGQRGLNMPSYYRLQHLQNKWDNAGLDLFTGEEWAKWKDRIDNTPNEGMKFVMADILRGQNMTEEQMRAAYNYASCTLTLRGMNIGAIKAAQLGLTDDRSIEQDNAYVEGRQAKDEEKHDIQIEFEDRSHELAEKLGITEQQLDNMSDEELESLTGKDDQLDNLIYDYQTSHAKYQGVVDNADDEIDKAAQEAARQTDMATDKSRGTVRNATIKATKGEEDYGVYIVSGNVATNEDGSINVGESDDMILYYDPKTGKIEHCDALRFAALGEEVNAEETRNQAIADAKEKAIRKQAGIIDGTVGEGTTFTITDAQGVEHTYEVLAENGDGSAMITLDGNVQETPVSLQDLQNLKDAEDAKSLEAAKMQRQQYEEEREKRNAPVEDNLDYADIINTNGEVEIADVVDEEGNPMFPDAEEVFFVQNQGNRAKVMVLDKEGNLKPKLVDKSAVQPLGTMSVDEYRQERQKTLKEAENESEPSLVDETETSNNVVPTDNTTTNETQPGNEAGLTTPNETQNEGDLNASNEQESTSKITLEDGTEVPMLEDGNPDFSQLTAGQVAELYDTQFGEDAGQIITNNVDRSKKALDKANAMTVQGGSFVEQKASKEAKDKAIAEAQAKYDSAKAIEDAYNERMLAKEEDTPEGRRNLIEKARRKFNRMKSSVKDNAQAIAQLYNETVGSLLHRLYDSTGIDVFDDTANTVDEYVASSIAPYSLNYEGTETSKGVKQETGLSRADFAKTGFLAKEGKGKTIDQLSNDLWRDRPENLQNITDQDVRNAIIDLITSGQTAFGLKNHIQNLRIAEAENILEQQKRQADELAHAEKQKEEESQSTGMVDNNAEDASNADVTPADEQTEDNLSDMPFEAPSPDEDAPFSAKDKAKDPLEVWNNMTDEEKAAYIEQNRVKDTRLVDDVVGKKLRKAIEKIAGMMGANIQWQRTDMIRNGWFNPTTKTIYLALDSSILEGVQFVFGHEMTHDIKKESPAMYDELKGLVKEKYGEELFKAMTDDNEQRYADAGKRGYDRSYYEEETVADAIGKMINDLNLTRSIALKMSHPLLAKIHDVLLKVKNALMATQYSDDVKGIIRTIEMAYVKTANGTFESSASEGTNDEQFSVRDANERFNNEIENFKNKSHKGLLHLGTPSPILKACGVDVDEITLSPKVLNRKLNQHSLTTEDVKDLVNAIQKPIMVYKHGEEAPNIVVITNADIRGNKLSLSLELDADGNVTKLNNVSSIHDKDAETEINRWLSWDEGYLEKALRWVDKEKVSDWLSSARLNSYSQTENNQKLSSIAKILNDFENPNISEENISNDDENVSYSLRQKPEPEKKGIGYKVFVLGKDGKLYPPMVANPNGAATPVGVWLDADAAPVAGESKTGRPQVKQGGKGTQGGSGKLAYRPGWHLGVIPYAIQFNRKDAEGNKTLFPKNFVFAEVEYAADKDYQDEAHAEGINGNGKYQHSLAGLKHLPTDGYYMYRTNPNPETDPWVITGAMKVNRLLTRAEQADIVRKAGREPQKIQEGDIVTDDVVNSINQEIAAAPKFSLKVYHGSGADFTEFDFDHMGEGAGSQAFGWGGYVTSSKKIGKSYADLNRVRNLPEDIFDTENKKAAASYVQKLITQGYDKESAIQEVRSKYEGFLDNLNRDETSRKNNGVAILNLKERIATLDEIEEGKLPLPKVSLYEVEIPEDNGSNYLEWEEKPSDEVATKIIEGLYGLDAKTLDDMASKDIVFRTLLYDYIKNADKRQMIPLLVKTHALTRGTTYDNGNAEDDIRFVYTRLSNWMGSPKAASQFLSSIGYTGIKYPAGTIMGGAKEGDMNYVIFKPEDMQIVEHEKFSVKKMIFDPREISDTEKQRRGDMLIHATPVDVAKDQIIKTENLSARKVAEQWWRKNIGSPLYYETEIGKVEINENSIQSSLAHRYGQAKLDAITSLKDGFNNAVYLGTIPDFVRTRDNVQNHYFAYPINYDGKRCYVFCRAMEDANKNSLYVHEVFVADNIQKEGNTLQTAAFKPHGGIALYKHILSDVLSAANVANSSETSKGNAGKFSLRLQDAINETDTEPTEAQKKSGNYKKGHVKFGGYDYTIENPKGSYRSGVDENGKEWKQKMNDTYGYIRGKFGKDGDHLDMFINDNADLDNWNGDVFVVDQVNPDGKFDEHKVMYGYDSLEEAKKAYLSNYEKGWTGLGNITPVSKADFDKWLDKSNRKLKPFADYADITSKTDMDTAPSSFEEFLDVVRYSIRNEKERAAAEDAYNFAQENRPDRYSRYAIVNMEKPGAVPQYLEKKTAADNWRRYYNKLKWGNYKLFDLDKPFEDNVKNLVGKFPETFRQGNEEKYSLIGKKGAEALDHAEEVSIRLDNLSVARQMEEAKKDAKAIKMATGWERGADGKWRYEIPDAKLSDMTDIDGKGTMVKRNTEDMLWTSGKLGDKVDAPSLFKAYPDLKDVRLETDAITNGLPSNGSFNPKINTITIHANNLKYLNSILNHEIQHAVQKIEGFAKGGSLEMFHDPSESDRLYTKFDNFVKRIYGNSDVKTLYGILDGVTDKDKEFVKVLGDKYSRMLESLRATKKYTSTKVFKEIYDRTVKEGAKPSAFKQYQALAGEVESRNVQSRMGMSPEERRKTLAEETEDVARKDQIFLYGDNDAYSLKQDKDRKQAQMDIILKTNPMLDDYHTGIRKVEDIKTLEESVGEARSEAEKYGDEEWSAYPDITNDMLQNALETGEITIYSSKPIKNGVFVTPSYMQASDYAGGGNVYEKTVPLTDVAWINTDEGQYAKVDGERMPYQDSIEADKRSLKGIAEGKVESLSELSERLKEMKTSDEVDNAITNAVDAMPEGWRQANKKTINIARAIAEDRKAEMNGEDPKFSLKKIGGSLIKGGTYFSGGGLVEEGLKGIIDPVIAVEYDEKISGVYRNNFGNHIVTADVRDVDPKELVDKIDGEVEYFHASPVCKNYSLAKNNHEELELDKETAASTAEFIKAVKPKVVTIENVKGYKDSDAMKTITDALDEAGYKWDANVYNAADYSGYTNRERLIVRAVLDGELPPVPKTQKRKSGWYEAVEDIIPTLTEKKNGVASWMDERLKADGIDWRHIDKPLYVMGSGYANGTVPHAFADELLPTLRTKSGDVIVMPDGKVYRAMGRVLARVSGVSDDYQMPASEALSHTIIGNGIPTQLTENVIAPLVRDVLHPAVEERASLKDVNEEEKYSLRVDRYRDDLNQWKKDNNLPKDAERPQLPVREPNESAADFLKRVKEYRKQAALWATAPTYEDHLLTSDTAQGQFNLEMQRKAVLTRIVVQDSMLAIRKAQEAIMKEYGVDKLNSAEDAYTAENRSHGKAKNEFEEYNDEFLQPLRKAYNELMLRLGKSYDNVKVYMIAKHGLERNAHIAFKYALGEDFETNEERMDAYNNYKSDIDRLNNDADFEAGRIDFATWKQRDGNIRTKYAPSYFKFRFDENGKTMDYSGLSALFDADDFEGAAADLVKDVEDANPYFTDELWYATNDATKKILRDSYNAGMMTEDNFNFVSGMYRNYIPLRGWGDTNADQVWNYVGGGKGAFSQVVKEAKGRKSLADDPIAYIENMAESAILMNNRNWVKQHLLLLAQNHRTSLLHVSKAWYIKTKDAQGNEEWIPASPQITEGMTSRQVELALEAFEQKMEQMKQNGEATQKREHLEISYPQTNGEEREHEVRVMKGGEEYVIYVNGDPQLAQAVNNTRARKVREGIEESVPLRVLARTGRYMAAAYTSRNPLFIPSNYMRDLTMTLSSTAIREDARYNRLLRRNMLRHWNTFPMVLSYQNGTLREKVRNGSASEVEKMFYDFMMNGGETGFVTSVDVEDLKKKFRNDLKDLNRMAANPKKVGHIIMDSIETLNRAIEDSNRFMVYMTSIQYGRSIEEAVNNAKDVTLNFNRKGTGEHGWQAIRDMFLFINPAVQSLQTLGALAKHHRFKFTTVTTGWLATGLLAPMLNNLLMSFFGGDDDKDKYWQFTKWDRRNNFIMWIPFTKEFVKIPLAQEFRGFYGVGDMIASKLWGGEKAEESWRDYALDLMGQIVDMLPLDPTGYDGNIGLALTPNAARPIGELALNVDFTGKPIFKDSEYNKYDPNFTKAYVGTPDWLVRISKMVNSIDNKYPDVEQNAIDRFGDPRFNLNNPAVVDHVLSSYLGGAYTMGSQILGVATKALNGDDIKMADIPLASKFVSNPDDRPVSKKQGEEFWDMKERHDRAANTLSKLKQKAKADGDYSTLDIFFGSDEYRQYKEDDKKVKKYEEDRKKEKAQETGEEYRPHKTTADDVYKSHATPKDDFEDMKMKQLYEKLNSYKIRYEAIDGISSEKGGAYYKANKAAIDAIEEIAYDKSMISTIKKGFLSDGQDSYDADGMKDIREMRKRILDVLEKANKTMMNNRK